MEAKAPASAKKQKTEGRADEQQQVSGAVKPPPPSSLNPAPGGEKLPQPEPDSESESVARINPIFDNYSLQSLRLTLSESEIWGSDGDDDELFRKDAANLARGALDHYNNKEGTNYVVDDAGRTAPINFNGALVYHLNFTANEEEEENSPSRHPFFAEIVTQYGRGCRVVDCIKMNTFAPEHVRKGCIYCPEHVDHPPVEYCKYGTNAKDDDEELEGKIYIRKKEADCP